jgi:hypothetical protein
MGTGPNKANLTVPNHVEEEASLDLAYVSVTTQ